MTIESMLIDFPGRPIIDILNRVAVSVSSTERIKVRWADLSTRGKSTVRAMAERDKTDDIAVIMIVFVMMKLFSRKDNKYF